MVWPWGWTPALGENKISILTGSVCSSVCYLRASPYCGRGLLMTGKNFLLWDLERLLDTGQASEFITFPWWRTPIRSAALMTVGFYREWAFCNRLIPCQFKQWACDTWRKLYISLLWRPVLLERLLLTETTLRFLSAKSIKNYMLKTEAECLS